MTQTFTIPGQLVGLNEYTKACRGHKLAGASMKKREQAIVGWCLTGLKPVEGPVVVNVTWYEPNRMRDPDNVRFAIKFILDALVSKGTLAGDGWKHIAGINDTFDIDRERPRIVVTIAPAGKEHNQ